MRMVTMRLGGLRFVCEGLRFVCEGLRVDDDVVVVGRKEKRLNFVDSVLELRLEGGRGDLGVESHGGDGVEGVEGVEEGGGEVRG